MNCIAKQLVIKKCVTKKSVILPLALKSNRRKKNRVISLFLLLCMPWLCSAAELELEHPTLNVRGEALLQVEPDQVTVALGVVSESDTAKAALADNSRVMKKVIAALLSQGLKKKDISTRQFGVQPKWSSRPRKADNLWRSEIIGYQVNNTVEVTTMQLVLIGDLIGSATAAGANQVQSVSFSLSNPREFRSQAITQAVKNAREDANVAAKASGNRIKGVKTIHIDQAIASIERAEKAMVMRSSMADSAPAPPISSGDITVRASVSIVYELTP